MDGVLSPEQINAAREAIDKIKANQELRASDLGIDLAAIQDEDVVRALLVEDPFFLWEIAMQSAPLTVIRAAIGDRVVLHSQVATVSRPGSVLYQTAWHRELQYQHFVSSRPLAMQSIFCIDPFTPKSGATFLIPGSHRFEEFPSQNYVELRQEQFLAEPGDVLIMDSMVYHRAGVNLGDFTRRLITNTFTVPIIGQQIDLTAAIELSMDESVAALLGGRWNAALSTESWRLRAAGRRNG